MEVPIIKVGNSKGLRLNKMLIDKYGFKDKIELVLTEEGILLKPLNNPREGWAEKMKSMHDAGDDTLLIEDVFEDDTFED